MHFTRSLLVCDKYVKSVLVFFITKLIFYSLYPKQKHVISDNKRKQLDYILNTKMFLQEW